jgi:hypothetical protein
LASLAVKIGSEIGNSQFTLGNIMVSDQDFDSDASTLSRPAPAPAKAGKLRWSGVIKAIQPRGWVWRYKSIYRTPHLKGFNLWVVGAAGKVVVAITALQQQKLGFQYGDTVSGTAWPVQDRKREVADLYRAGDLKVLDRPVRNSTQVGPPFIDIMPGLDIYKQRGCRMLDPTLWRTTCMWANKSRVEIEVVFGKAKRYRSETFCYGPKSCPNYAMGKPRDVPYRESWKNFIEHVEDCGELDSILTDHRGEDD